jgi:two-component system sensor histidine kinase PilS (NtrC family)
MPDMLEDKNASEVTSNRTLLRIYACYRFVLASLLLTFSIAGINNDIFGSSDPYLFYSTAVIYVGLTFFTLFVLASKKSRPPVATIFIVILCDIVAISLFMYSSGGIKSGLEFLLIVCVAAGSIFVTGQLALLLAAIASLCAMLTSLIGIIGQQESSNSLFQAGMIGALLFLTALIFQFLAKRITAEQQKSCQEIQFSEQLKKLNEHIIRRMRTGIIVVNKHDIITLINSSAVQLLSTHNLTESLSLGTHLKEVERLYEQLTRWTLNPGVRPKPFKENNIEIQANFIELDQENDEQILIFLEDTSSLTQHAQQIKQASLGRLTANIAHEIRNPIGAISHAAQILQEEPDLTNQQTRLVDIIKKQSDRVNELIENIMQMSRQSTPRFKTIKLYDWLNNFSNEFMESTDKKISLKIDGPQQVTGTFDPSQLTQLIINLVDNAIRHSHENTGNYSAELIIGINKNNGHPYLDIIDFGRGVPEQNIHKIFEPFFTTSHTGSGLGLYICRELCTFNFATLDYLSIKNGQHRFRIGFSHPARILPGSYK